MIGKSCYNPDRISDTPARSTLKGGKMSLTKKDIQIITDIVENGVSGLREDVKVLKEDVSVLKEDVSVLKEDVSELKEDVSELKDRVSVLEEDVGVLKEDVSSLKEDVGVLKEDVSGLKDDVTRIQVVQLESRVIPCINEIVEYQKSTYDRYNKQSDLFEDKISLLDATAQEVERHSEQIRELQLETGIV